MALAAKEEVKSLQDAVVLLLLLAWFRPLCALFWIWFGLVPKERAKDDLFWSLSLIPLSLKALYDYSFLLLRLRLADLFKAATKKFPPLLRARDQSVNIA